MVRYSRRRCCRSSKPSIYSLAVSGSTIMTTEVDVQDLRDVIVLDVRINRFDRNERCVGDDEINTIAKVTAAWAMLICTATC
jgi:hypothetical protein